MIHIRVRGTFNAKKGEIIEFSKAYIFSDTELVVPELLNKTTGEKGAFGKPMMTVPLTPLNKPAIYRVDHLERHGDETQIFVDELSKKAFLSYSTKDKIVAHGLKDLLAKYNIDSFCAHDDIEVSATWREQIKLQLDSCDMFFPIITKNFKESEWANQETGYAIAKDKVVVPLMLNVATLKGLIEEKQGIPGSSDNLTKLVDELIGKLKLLNSSS